MRVEKDTAPESLMNDVARGVRGGGIVIVGSAASLVIQFASLALLSRLLEPEDFGLVAMVFVFVVLANLVRDFGLPMAGLQMRSLSHQQASNLFWMNVSVACVAAGLLYLSTPALVALYGDSRLKTIVPLFAFVVLLGGFGAQIQVQLARRMRFGTLVVSDIVAQLAALAVAAFLAALGAGYWALVVQAVANAVVALAYRWVAAKWLPSRFRRGHDAARIMRVGAHLGMAQMLTFAQSNVDTLLIGARLGAGPLGYYNRAYQLLTAPAGRLLDPLTQVVVTTLNRVEAQGRDSQVYLMRIQFLVGTLVVWSFGATAGAASSLLPLVLGANWTPAVPVFQILAAGGCVWVFNHVSYWAFIVYEKSRELLHYNLVSKPLAIVCIAIGSQFGIEGVACGYALAMAISWPLNLIWLTRTAGLDFWLFLGNGVRVLLAGCACAAGSFAAGAALQGTPAWVTVIGGVTVGTAAMALATISSPQAREILRESLGLAKALTARRREVLDASD